MVGNDYDTSSPFTVVVRTRDRDADVSIGRSTDNQNQDATADVQEHRPPAILTSNEPPLKKIKLEYDGATSSPTVAAVTDCSPSVAAQSATNTQANDESTPLQATLGNHPLRNQDSHEGSTVVTTVTDATQQTCPSSSTNSSRGSLETGSPAAGSSIIPPPATAVPAAAAPLKSLTYTHLNTKYLAELEYMLREFRKLERQLLGAKGAAQLEESAGSRERREKLHSFILHLEDTVRQIEVGCKLEAEGNSGNANGTTEGASNHDNNTPKKQMAEVSALSNMTKEKEQEENVQKLEEHILANLLPVKVRLKKQLAAQQGATQNPAGMPSRRGSLQPPSSVRGKGTFAEAAEKKRKQAEEARLAAQEEHERTVRRVSDPSQFGKPLGGGGSSLTRNLHGSTLGSTRRILGHGVGAASKPDGASEGNGSGGRKILYAGMVPGSTQHESGLSAASGAHDMIMTNQRESSGGTSNEQVESQTITTHASSKATVPVEPNPIRKPPAAPAVVSGKPQPAPAKLSISLQKKAPSQLLPKLSEEEQRKLRKKRRKRKILRLAKRQERERLKQQDTAQQQTASNHPPTANTVAAIRKKPSHTKGQKKKGPRAVEYICSLCSEAYNSTCDYNPWWALAQHECPKCRKTQVRCFVAVRKFSKSV
jgi:hypothetical protein